MPIALKIFRRIDTHSPIEYLCLDLGILEFYWSQNKIGALETFIEATAARCINTLEKLDPNYDYGYEHQE